MTPAEQTARDQDLHKVNALLGHWRGGINPCTCWRCQDVAAAIEQARREEREACIGDIRHLMIYGDARDQRPTYDKGWSEALLEAETNIRARTQELGREVGC